MSVSVILQGINCCDFAFTYSVVYIQENWLCVYKDVVAKFGCYFYLR